jgi:glycosyltransferase involved in cell wall biosynthesis
MEVRPILSIVSPVYNGGKHIYRNIHETLKELEKIGVPFELIIVDDGSTDNTFEEASLVKDGRVRIIHYEKNKGKGNALRRGLDAAKGELVTFLDSDLDIHPSQLSTLIRTREETGADMVIASKRHKDSVVHYPITRKIMSRCYYQFFVRPWFGLDLTDTQTGLKLFRTEALRDIMPKILVKQYAFDLELCVVAQRKGYMIVEAPVILDYQNTGSGIRPKTIYKMAVDTAAIWYRVHVLDWYETEGGYEPTNKFPYIRKLQSNAEL